MRPRGRKARGQSGGGPDPRGDVPHQPKRTYTTISRSLPPTTVQYTCRQMESSSFTATPTTAITNTYYFTQGGLDGASNFSAMFDQYRLDAIRFSIIPQNNAINVQAAATVALAPVYCVIDYDDASALGSIAAARQYDNCIQLEPGESLSRTFQPRLALAAYSGSFASYGNMGPTWIDLASPNVQHYGIKVYVPGVDAAQTILQVWDVQIEYWFSYRSLRG